MRFSLRFVVRWPGGSSGWLPFRAAVLRDSKEGRRTFPGLTEIEARFRQAAEDLDRDKLRALASLAKNAKGEESEAAYRAAFNLAVARNLYAEAEPAARAYLTREAAGDSAVPGPGGVDRAGQPRRREASTSSRWPTWRASSSVARPKRFPKTSGSRRVWSSLSPKRTCSACSREDGMTSPRRSASLPWPSIPILTSRRTSSGGRPGSS